MRAPPSSRGRRRVWLAASAAAGVVLLVALLAGRKPPPPEAPEPETTPLAWPALPTPPRPVAPAPAEEPAEEPRPAAPIIDAIHVEKPEVCEGEENLITVEAHTPAGRDDAFLHYFVGTSAGKAVPLRAFRSSPNDPTPGPMRVQVFGRDNVVTSVPLPSYTIKKCRPERSLFLRVRQMPNTIDEIELTAKVVELSPSPPLRVTAYRWSFGDGAKIVTAGPTATHRYAPKDPDALYSEYLIVCEAVGGDGRTVMGRTAFPMVNTELENLEFHKTLVLSVELTPRFPELDSRGHLVQTVRLYHHRSAPVRLERATLTYDTGTSEGAPPPETRAAAEVLGTEEIPPGFGVERKLRFEPASRPGVRMVNYELEGRTADGIPAAASFSLMLPPPVPTPQNGARVSDPLLTRKIVRARERLGKPYVNDEDLRRLENEGVFADLAPAPPAAPATGAPAVYTPTPAQVQAALAAKGGRPPVTR